ncbi:MAG: hypothetical protein IPH16_19780 [Haliscomenobacter sp.]|nr:hypothetical protein [Haliscomenobacter sp.]
MIRDVADGGYPQGSPHRGRSQIPQLWAYKHTFVQTQPQRDPLRYGPVEAGIDSLRKASLYIREKLGNAYTMITLSERAFLDAQGQTVLLLPSPGR